VFQRDNSKFWYCKLTILQADMLAQHKWPAWTSSSVYFRFILWSTQLHFNWFSCSFQRAFESHCCRLDFAVLSWNPAQDFYKAKGAINITEEEGWHHYRLDREALAKLSLEVNKAAVTND
jgi:hypothetical protein